MTTKRKTYDLRSVEPIAPVEDDATQGQEDRVDRVGFAVAASAGSTPAVGVAAERMDETPPDAPPEAEDEDRQSR